MTVLKMSPVLMFFYQLPNKECLIVIFKCCPIHVSSEFLSISVKTSWFYCKRLQNDRALNCVHFLDHSVDFANRQTILSYVS